MTLLEQIEAAAKKVEQAQEDLKAIVVEAQANGIPDSTIAKAAGVTRGTIYNWTKRDK